MPAADYPTHEQLHCFSIPAEHLDVASTMWQSFEPSVADFVTTDEALSLCDFVALVEIGSDEMFAYCFPFLERSGTVRELADC
jgi:hypothetical protein